MIRGARILAFIVGGLFVAGLATAQEVKVHFRWNNQFSISNKGTLRPVFVTAGQKTGVKVTDVTNPVSTNDSQEFQLQAAEQFTKADIYGGASLAPYFYSYGREGGFVDLTGAMAKGKLPNFKKFLDANPDIKASLLTPDGKMYYMPYLPDGGVARVYWLRTDWLAKLGLKVPTTTEELEKVLTAFKDKDANGNGKKDEIPYFNDKYKEGLRFMNLFGARVYGNDNYDTRVITDSKGSKMYHAWVAPAFKVAVKEMARWYKAGLIDQELFTRKENTARKELLTKLNIGGMTHEWVGSTSGYNDDPAIKKSVPNFKFEVIAPVAAKGAKAFEEHARMSVKPDGWAISSNSKNQDAALKFMDWFWSEEGRNTTNFGVQGQTWKDLDPKTKKPVYLETALKWQYEAGGMNRALWDKQGAQAPLGYKQDFAYEAPWTHAIGMVGVNLYKDPKKVSYAYQTPVLTFTAQEQEIVTAGNDQLIAYQEEQVIKWITGRGDVDKEWDAYVKHSNELGAQKLVAAMQAAYDRYLKNAK